MKRWLVMGMLMFGAVAVARPTPEPAAMAARLATALGLDEATKGEVEALLTAAMDEGRPLREKAYALEAELRAERERPEPDMKKVEKLVHQLAELKADGMMIRMRTADSIEALLTPEQAARFRELRARREAEERRPGAPGAAPATEGL
jgi:Spy/CpxP family protein refolding chaperone